MRAWAERAILLAAGGLAFWALRNLDLRALAGVLGPGAWGWIIFLFALSTFLAFLPSWLYLRNAGHRVPLASFCGIMLASQALNSTNPLRMGFPFRVYLLKERHRVPLGAGSLLIPLEAFAAFVVALGAALLAAPLHHAALAGPWRAGLVLAAISGVVATITLARLAAAGRISVPRRLPGRAASVARAMLEALSRVTPLTLANFAILYLASDLAVAGILDTAVGAAGFDAPFLYLFAAYCAAYLIGSVSFMPQGLGTRDAALGLLLHAAGAAPDQAAYGALVVRVATTGFSFLFGMLSAWAIGLSRKGSVSPSHRTLDALGLGGRARRAAEPREGGVGR
ncbi:MAG: lysylphosphatidylglycerol synthase transmembrane domain-containing protein [Deltaproteobacteria bacterium]|nr:lysylphosphatidylglycerol synthase transmembrane domain-containing protein [Deltaproteobacteria bacterium]